MRTSTATTVISTEEKHHNGLDAFDVEAMNMGRAEYRLSELRPFKKRVQKNSRGKISISRK